jgi:imidazolonepropionase-like amidohydrolase
MPAELGNQIKRIQQETKDAFTDPNMLIYYPKFAIVDVIDNQASPETYLRPEQIQLRACGYKNHAKFIGDLVAAGGQVAVASDITQTPPGLGVHQEMAVMQEDAHMPPMKVLQAATSWNAKHFHINDIGSIEVGKLADLDIVIAARAEDNRPLRPAVLRPCERAQISVVVAPPDRLHLASCPS